MIEVFYRQAEVVSGPFEAVARVASGHEAIDELASWSGPALHHGDVVRVVSPSRESLFVFDARRSSFFEAVSPGWTLFDVWEGEHARGDSMLRMCRAVDLRKVICAACDCVEPSLRFSPRDPRARNAVEAARRWAEGSADAGSLSAAAAAAATAATSHERSGRTFAAYAAMNVAYAAYAAATVGAGGDSDIDCVSAAVQSVRMAADASLWGLRRGGIAACSEALRRAAIVVRAHIPLSVIACAIAGVGDPIPFAPPRPASAPRRGR